MRIVFVLHKSVIPQGGNTGQGGCFTEQNKTKKTEQQQSPALKCVRVL